MTGVINLASPARELFRAVITGPGTNQLTLNGGGAMPCSSSARGTTNKLGGLRLANASSRNAGASVASLGRTVIENCASPTVSRCRTLAARWQTDPDGRALRPTVFSRTTLRGGGRGRGAGEMAAPAGWFAGWAGRFHGRRSTRVTGAPSSATRPPGGNGGNGDGTVFRPIPAGMVARLIAAVAAPACPAARVDLAAAAVAQPDRRDRLRGRTRGIRRRRRWR